MINAETVTQQVYEAIDQLNEQLDEDRRLAKSPATRLFGEESQLDSVSFVTLMVAIEQNLDRALGLKVSLIEQGLSEGSDDRVRTVATLVAHVLAASPTHSP